MSRRWRPRRGVSLVEILVALSILSVVLMALGGLMYRVARQTRKSAVATYRTGAAQLAASWIQGMPWNDLSLPLTAGPVGCTSDSLGMLEYNRCVTVTDVGSSRKSVQIVIQPTGNLTAPPETQVIVRARVLLPSALWSQ